MKREARSSFLPHAGAAALYLALALRVAWPLWAAPDSRIESAGDPLLNAYLVDWSQFAIFRQLFGFFQATMYWPHADSLAYGEHLIAPAVLGLPFRWAGLGAVGVHNLSLAQAFWFSALAAHALGWATFRRFVPALATGLAYGFGAYRLSQASHLQLVHGEFLPLMVLAFERSLGGSGLRSDAGAEGRPASGVTRYALPLLALACLGQWLTSWYWAVFSFVALGPYFAWRLAVEFRKGRKREAARTFAAIAIAAAATVPAALPYARLAEANAFYRPPNASAGLAARAADFLNPPQRAWIADALLGEKAPKRVGAAEPLPDASAADPLSPPRFPARTISSERRLFPGFAFSIAAIVGLGFAFGVAARGVSERGPALRPDVGSESRPTRAAADSGTACGVPAHPVWWGATAIGLTALCFGGDVVEAVVPFAGTMRVPARWMLPALLPWALTIGFGVLGWTERTKGTGRTEGTEGTEWTGWTVWTEGRLPFMGSAVLLCGALVLESVARPSPWIEVPSAVPEVYRLVAAAPFPSPVFEIPVAPSDDQRHLLAATWHRQPTLNGTNGFVPPGRPALLRTLATFPAPEAVEEMRRLRVRFVVIDLASDLAGAPGSDPAFLDRLRIASAEAAPGASWNRFGDRVLVDLGPSASPDAPLPL